MYATDRLAQERSGGRQAVLERVAASGRCAPPRFRPTLGSARIQRRQARKKMAAPGVTLGEVRFVVLGWKIYMLYVYFASRQLDQVSGNRLR